MHRYIPALLTLLAIATPSFADESCATQAAQLLARGQTAELAAWFQGTDATVSRGLARLADELGRLDEVTPLAHPSQGQSRQLRVAAPGLASDYRFHGSWAAARSQHRGRVEVQASAVPGAGCTLLALQVQVQVQGQ